jgi:hypothetical protein
VAEEYVTSKGDVMESEKGFEVLNVGILTGEFVNELWHKVSQVPDAFDDRMKERPDIFLASMFGGSVFITLGDFGLAIVSGIIYSADANVHIAIWDSSNPRLVFSTIKSALAYVFQTYELVRCTTVVGDYNSTQKRFLQLLGFIGEGRIRKGVLHNGQFCDALLYGLLREEFFVA